MTPPKADRALPKADRPVSGLARGLPRTSQGIGLPRPGDEVREAPAPGWRLASGDLPDLNVWLALSVSEHPHHAAAHAWWTQALEAPALPGPRLWFCRVTALGLVRLLCQPKVVGAGALDLPRAWAHYQALRAHPAVGLLPEPPDAEQRLAALLHTPTLPARLWTDAWLAATALAGGIRLVTFDRDFERFALPRCLVLTG